MSVKISKTYCSWILIQVIVNSYTIVIILLVPGALQPLFQPCTDAVIDSD